MLLRLRLREFLLEKTPQRRQEVQWVRCRIVVLISWSLMHLYLSVLLRWCDFAFSSTAAASKQTPLKKWSPQRVPDTRHRPMSSRVSIHVPWVQVMPRFSTLLSLQNDLSHLVNAAVFRSGLRRHSAHPSSAFPRWGAAPLTWSHTKRWEQNIQSAFYWACNNNAVSICFRGI